MIRRATLRKNIRTSPPWAGNRVARAGERVVASWAANLPADSPIKWWIEPVDPSAEWACDAIDGYGVGAHDGDLAFLEGG